MTRSIFAVCVLAATCSFASADIPGAIAHDSYTFNHYTESQMHTFGAAVDASVTAGASYAGIATQVVGLVSGPPTTDANYDRLTAPHGIHQPSTIPPYLGSVATLLAGANASGNTQTISMAWRNRVDIEVNSLGYPMDGPDQFPPMAFDSYGIASDVVHLTGVTGAYVLQMTYDPAVLVWEQPWVTELWLAQHDKIYLSWFETEEHKSSGSLHDQREWVHATVGNTGEGANVITNYQGGFDDFIAEYTDFTPETYLGSYGVDYDNKTVWAVINHNSEFAVVPEPATLSILTLAGLALLRRRGKK